MNKETKLTEMMEIYVKQMLLPKEELALQTMELMTDKMISENNWNELKEWLKTQYLRPDDYSDYETAFTMTLNKMQEIEGGVDNDK